MFPSKPASSAESTPEDLSASGIPPLGHSTQRKANAKVLFFMGLGALGMLGLLYVIGSGGDQKPPPATANATPAVPVPPPPPVLAPAPVVPEPVSTGTAPGSSVEEVQALRLRRTATDTQDGAAASERPGPQAVIRSFAVLPPVLEYRHIPEPEDPGLALMRKRMQPATGPAATAGAVAGGVTGPQPMPPAAAAPVAGADGGAQAPPAEVVGDIEAYPVHAARRVPLKASSYIPQGTALRCVLQTEVVTDVPGPVQCNVTEDVFSFDASRVLLPRGTRVLGEYRRANGSLDRVAMVWSRLITPDNVDISVDSPGVTTLGAMGVPAYLDNRWADRFASALMVSLASDAFKIAVQRNAPTIEQTTVANGVTTVTREPFDSATVRNTERFVESDVANKIQIQPRLVIPQGSVVSILTAQDLNFAQVLGAVTPAASRSQP